MVAHPDNQPGPPRPDSRSTGRRGVDLLHPLDLASLLYRRTFFGQPVTFTSQGSTIRADIHFPPELESEERLPAVTLVHGLGGNRNEANGLFIKAAATLAINGYVALRIDMRGAGETGGSTLDIDLARQMADVSAAIDYLQERHDIDKRRLGLVGLSMGGLACGCLAGQRADIAALCLWEPPFDLKEAMTRLFGIKAVSAVKMRGYLQAGLMRLGESFFDVLEHISPGALAASYAGPVLILHGTNDMIVPVTDSQRWLESFSRARAELKLIPDGDHAFTLDTWAWQAVEMSVAWFKKTL